MNDSIHSPVLIVIAGPNGSGKTTITSQILHHEWLENLVYINTDQVAQERFGDWNSAEDFIRRAKKAGFFIRLFFVCTESPMINAARIDGRVMKGGHDVPITKIISRYQKSIINCKVATSIADRVYLYDNSVDGQEARILFRFADGEIIKRYTDDIPLWAQGIYDFDSERTKT